MSVTIESLVSESHRIARSKGWWENPDKNVGELLALVHSEISEALEVYRDYGIEGLTKTWLESDGKPEGFTIELADAVIRIADICGGFNLNLEEAIETKMSFNESRPYRHGAKKA